jgi:hypothetical protein
MANISYHVVLPANLSLKRLPLKQIEVILDITGAQVDPLTLQQIRDEDSIKQCFLARRANINDLIGKTAADLAKVKNDRDGEALVNEFNRKLEAEIKTLQKELQVRADAFVQKQKKNVNDLFWAQAKLVVRVVWAIAKYVKGGMEISGKVTAAVTAGVSGAGAFLSVVAIKSLINTVNDLNGATDELLGAMEGERSQFVKLRDAIKEIKKFKKPDKVPQNKIDAVSMLMGPYGARLLGVDVAAKKTATKLDNLLKDLDKGKFRNQAAQKEIEDKVDALIHKIIERSKNVTEGRKLLQAAKDKVADAGKRALKDPISFWDVAGYLWKAFDGVVDCGEAVLEKPGYDTVVDTVVAKLNDELKDAIVAEHTQV